MSKEIVYKLTESKDSLGAEKLGVIGREKVGVILLPSNYLIILSNAGPSRMAETVKRPGSLAAHGLVVQGKV
jgi:hypothetical protein